MRGHPFTNSDKPAQRHYRTHRNECSVQGEVRMLAVWIRTDCVHCWTPTEAQPAHGLKMLAPEGRQPKTRSAEH